MSGRERERNGTEGLIDRAAQEVRGTRGGGPMMGCSGQAKGCDVSEPSPQGSPASIDEQVKVMQYEMDRLQHLQRDIASKERYARLDHLFSYHAPTEEQKDKYNALRHYGRLLAQTVLENVPAGADQSEAIHLIRTAVMTANAGIALGGKS